MRIFGAPSRYAQGPGALDRLGELIEGLSRRPLVVADADVLALIAERLATTLADRPHHILAFRGEVTHAAIAALADEGRAGEADAVIGIGGGKGLDAAKGVALALAVPFIAVPSIASNDSPTARSLAIYDEHHTLVAIDALPSSPLLVVADTALIAGAPPRFLRAGMGDAVAKKFEVERAIADGANNFFGTPPLRTTLAIADACYATLREHGVAALRAAERHAPDEAFEAVVEASILMAGLAWENGGLSYAHAVVRGLVRARGASSAAHGAHVAYGTLVQLAVEDRPDAMIEDLAGFYRDVGLPVSLSALGMEAPAPAELDEIARLTAIGPKGGRIVVRETAATIAAAIRRIEAMAA